MAEDAGATVVFATGRPPRWMREVAQATGHRGIAVCSNGALVYDLHQEKIIEGFPLAPEIGRVVVEAIRTSIPGVSFGVEFGDRFGHEETYLVAGDRLNETFIGRISDLLVAEPVLKLLVKHEGYEPDQLLAKAREVAGDLVTMTHSSKIGLLEVSAQGISKASTLATLCAERGIDASEVVAFGDMPNDLAMLAWAGTPYAVTGGHPDVLAAVERRCPSNDDDGVASVLESLFR